MHAPQDQLITPRCGGVWFGSIVCSTLIWLFICHLFEFMGLPLLLQYVYCVSLVSVSFVLGVEVDKVRSLTQLCGHT